MTAPAAGRGECAPPSLPLELAHAAREPQAACALVYALLLGTLAERPPQMALLAAAQPQQARLAARLAQLLERLPRSARLPLLDLATPALRQLSDRQRQILLETAAQLIAADARITLAEFVVQTVLQRRLDPHAGRAVPVRFSSLGRLRAEVALLLSLVAHVAARAPEAMAPQAQQRFLRAAATCPELRLTAQDFQPASLIGFGPVRAALERATRLAPLAKPGLVKAWLAAAGADAGDGAADANAALSLAAADILHALCAAIDAPLPPVVAASRCGWHATAG